jgi:sarcosine oxidase subunit delta
LKLIPCPLNGLRNVNEFACAGEVIEMPAPDAPDEVWIDYIFMRDNKAGVVREWWFHIPTSYWFVVERDTVSDTILASYPADKIFNRRVDFLPRGAP